MEGGVEWYVHNISRELVKKGHEVEVLTTYPNNMTNLPIEDEIDGIKIHRFPLKLNFSYRAKIWEGLKENLQRGGYDIIHTYDYAQPHTYLSERVGASEGIPVALTIFDVHSLIPRSFYKRIVMSLFDNYVAKLTLKKADKALVRAPNLLPSLSRMGLPLDIAHVTPSGVVDEALEPANGRIFLNKYSVEGDPIILYLGRLHPMKGPQYLLEAAPKILSKYPDTNFVFVGPDQIGYVKYLKNMSERLSIEKNTFFTGPIYNFIEKMQAFASCDVFVMPSGYEGTSQAIFQAMAQGKPIVATNRGGIPFQLDNGRAGVLVKYGDSRDLSNEIIKLLHEKSIANDFGICAKNRVKKFTYSVLSSKLESIYLEMMEK
jgi:glycosyltransferase involved in cell wall biosynthesis